MPKMFQVAYVAEPAHDMDPLRPYAEKIRYITSGKERVAELEEVISENLVNFDPEKDVIVPVGKTVGSMIIGLILGRRFLGKHFKLGCYSNQDYEFIDVYLAGVQ